MPSECCQTMAAARWERRKAAKGPAGEHEEHTRSPPMQLACNRLVDGFGVAWWSQLPPKRLVYPLYAPCSQFACHWLGPTSASTVPSASPPERYAENSGVPGKIPCARARIRLEASLSILYPPSSNGRLAEEWTNSWLRNCCASLPFLSHYRTRFHHGRRTRIPQHWGARSPGGASVYS
jgi:hypothetical protein